MSDEPITVPQGEHQRAVDAVVDAIQANRGSPAAATVARREPNRTYNSADDSITYHSAEDAEIAAQAAPNADTLDGRNLEHEQRLLVDKTAAEFEKLKAFTFDPKTGDKVFTLREGSEARAIQERKCDQLMQECAYQKGVYEAALAAREARAAAKSRGLDQAAIDAEWVGGDPERQRILDRVKLEVEAKHIAEAGLRARLGQLGE